MREDKRMLLTVITQWMINTRFLILYYPKKTNHNTSFVKMALKNKKKERNGVND